MIKCKQISAAWLTWVFGVSQAQQPSRQHEMSTKTVRQEGSPSFFYSAEFPNPAALITSSSLRVCVLHAGLKATFRFT